MATDQIQRFPNAAALQARDLGGSAPSRPIGYISDEDVLGYEDEGGTLRRLVDSTQAQTLTNKSLTSPNVTTPLGSVYAVEVTITETAGAGTYTGAVTVPAGATILDIIVNGVALWTNAGAATLKVGDTDDDGYYTAVDLKATDLLAGESLSFALAGGKAGAYIANSQVSPRYSASARTINAIVTTASTGGGAGRTRVTVVYHLPVTADIVAATKV